MSSKQEAPSQEQWQKMLEWAGFRQMRLVEAYSRGLKAGVALAPKQGKERG